MSVSENSVSIFEIPTSLPQNLLKQLQLTVRDFTVTVSVYVDLICDSPREWSNLSKMICFHRRYTLGDEHEFKSPSDFQEFLDEDAASPNPRLHVLNLYMYDHSGVKISTSPFSCPWDSGRLGWIYVDLEEAAKDLYNDKKLKDLTPGEREKLIEYVNKAIDGELDVYNDYINGDVFRFSIQFRQEINEYVSIVRNDLEDAACGLYGSESLKEYLLDTFEHLLSIALKEEKTSEVIQKAVELLADKL